MFNLITLTSLSILTLSFQGGPYIEFKRMVHKDVFNRFPVKDNEVFKGYPLTIVYPGSISYSGYAGLELTIDYNQRDFLRLKKSLIEGSQFVSQVNDTCDLFLPLDNPTRCHDEPFPVPGFNDKFLSTKRGQLPSDACFIVIDSRRGEYLPKEYFSGKNDSISSKIGHGFSNGVILIESSQTILYWVIIW